MSFKDCCLDTHTTLLPIFAGNISICSLKSVPRITEPKVAMAIGPSNTQPLSNEHINNILQRVGSNQHSPASSVWQSTRSQSWVKTRHFYSGLSAQYLFKGERTQRGALSALMVNHCVSARTVPCPALAIASRVAVGKPTIADIFGSVLSLCHLSNGKLAAADHELPCPL